MTKTTKAAPFLPWCPILKNPREGQLLRERGYAEIVPVIGRYEVDDDEGLLLTTEYETMSSVERFWFANPNLRMRTSIVKRFGGFSTASFCAELRMVESADAGEGTQENQSPEQVPAMSAFGW